MKSSPSKNKATTQNTADPRPETKVRGRGSWWEFTRSDRFTDKNGDHNFLQFSVPSSIAVKGSSSRKLGDQVRKPTFRQKAKLWWKNFWVIDDGYDWDYSEGSDSKNPDLDANSRGKPQRHSSDNDPFGNGGW